MDTLSTSPRRLTIGSRVFARGRAAAAYRWRLAANADDLHSAQTLRFLVFNLELNEGLNSAYLTCRDADPFDEVCDHLLVEEVRTGDVVGTYRLQTGLSAAAHLGYYSGLEFAMAPLERWRAEIIEAGRACVHSQHRNLAVLGLLWQGIASYARDRGGRYLIGCSSMASQDPAQGAAAYELLRPNHLAPVGWHTLPLPETACPLDRRAERVPKLPRLLFAYLSIGARVCGPPAIDRAFKTIDFLTVLDLSTLPAEIIGEPPC